MVQDFLAEYRLMLVLLAASLLFGILMVVFTHKKFLALATFSILANLVVLVFYFFVDNLLFALYGIEWLQKFGLSVWPILNLAIIFVLARNKKI